MPCCWAAIDTTTTSSNPPLAPIAASSASHQALGSTSVPSGCGARPERTSDPLARSRMTALQLCVEESIPVELDIDEDTAALLVTMSAATIDRRLALARSGLILKAAPNPSLGRC
jgi:hypothetical protein